jgi:general secretion pathway protein D
MLANARMRLAAQVLEKAARDTKLEAWDEAQAGYRRAAALGEVDQAMVGMRALADAQHRARQKALAEAAPAKADAAPPRPRLGAAFQKRITLQFRDAPLRSVFEALARTSGINFTFDKDVSPDARVTLNLVDTTVEQAMHSVLLTSQMEQRVVDEHTVMVYPNDPAKQREYQKLTIRSFRIANAEAKAVANSLRTLLKTRDLVVDEKLNLLVLRDTPETLEMAARLVALHDVAEPEVMLEVEILEVQRSDLESLGIKWPGSVGLSPLGRSTVGGDGSVTTSPFTLNDLLKLNSRGLLAEVDPMKLSASVSRDNVSVLANPRIRIKSREKALIRVGERVPSVSANVTSTGVTSQSVNYLDVGLKLEAEPVVYMDGEVSIKLNLEVSSILQTIFDSHGQPYGYRIGARNAMTVLRLRDGENQVLAGLISDNDKRTASAIPGVGELPVLDRLFGSKGTERTKTEIVLSITPRIVRNQGRGAAAEVEFDAGTDASLRGREGILGQPALPLPVAPLPAMPAPEKTGT